MLAVLLSSLVIKIIDRQRRAIDFDIKGFLDGYGYTTAADTSRPEVKATTNVFDEEEIVRQTVKSYNQSQGIEHPLGKININKADVGQLQRLPGIGPVLAQRIVSYRDSVSFFHSEKDLLKVNGLGPKKLSKIIGYIEF